METPLPAEPQAQAATEPQATPQPEQTPEPAPVQEQQPSTDPLTEAAAAEAALEKLTNPEPAPVAEETPAPETATEQPAGETPLETPTEEEPRQEEPHEPSERYRFKDDEDKAVAALSRAQKISLVEAARIYSERIAPAVKPAEQTQQAQPRNITVLSERAVQLDASIAELETKIDTELEGGQLMTPELRKMQAELHRSIAGRETVKAQIETAYSTERAKDRAEMTREYPDLGDETTPLGLTVLGIITAWKDEAHPMHDNLRRVDAVRLASEAAVRSYASAIAKKNGTTLEEAMDTIRAKPLEAQPAPKPAAQKTAPKIAPASGTRTSVASQTPARPQTYAELLKEAGDDPDKIDALSRYLVTGRPEPLVRLAI